MRASDTEMIARHSVPEPNSGCWLWTGSVNECGYGRLGPDRSERQAHRLSWLNVHGAIPDGLLVLHRCDVPCCVNPNHLFLGTSSDNANDREGKGRGGDTSGSKNARAKLNQQKVDFIRCEHACGASISDLARRFSVSRRAIKFCVEYKTWNKRK